MTSQEEKWAIFWCDLIKEIIFGEIQSEEIPQFLKNVSQEEVVFPDGRKGFPSLSTLKRKLKQFQEGGFANLVRKQRQDKGKSRAVSSEVIAKAVELKKEQPYRSHITINRFIKEWYGVTIPKSTLYWHLNKADATRIKIGATTQKVRCRFTTDHTHDLWIGDFEEGPYVIEQKEVLPTYLSAFIDCHSRYVVEARYYLRQHLDVLIDSLIRALSKHGAPLAVYLDNAKVYHSNGLRIASYKTNIRLIYRPAGDPSPGGAIEKFFQTAQSQFEREVRAGDILSLNELNRSFSAWLSVSYHQSADLETKQTPTERHDCGLKGIRKVDIHEVIRSFMQRVQRTVNKTFSDVQVNKKLYKVNPKLRGDVVEVRYDPFSTTDTVEIYAPTGEYLGTGTLHHREFDPTTQPKQTAVKPKHNYLDLLVLQHNKQLDSQTKGIDYRNVTESRPWPFHEFAKSFADLLGKQGGLTAFTADELEKIKKAYNQSTAITKPLLKQAVENAHVKAIPYVIYELQLLIKKENT